MEFLSPEWVEAMARAADARAPAPDDPLAGVHVAIDQVVEGSAWRLRIDDGRMQVSAIDPDDPTGDVRMSMDRATAVAVATRRRSVLDAFIEGRIRVGGDLRVLLDNQRALAAVEDVFADVRAATTYDGG